MNRDMTIRELANSDDAIATGAGPASNNQRTRRRFLKQSGGPGAALALSVASRHRLSAQEASGSEEEDTTTDETETPPSISFDEGNVKTGFEVIAQGRFTDPVGIYYPTNPTVVNASTAAGAQARTAWLAGNPSAFPANSSAWFGTHGFTWRVAGHTTPAYSRRHRVTTNPDNIEIQWP